MAKGTGHARSAITGRYVTMTYAKSHPKTTVIEKSNLSSRYIQPQGKRGCIIK